MSEATITAPRRRRFVYRHTVLVRVTHWVNAICIVFLLLERHGDLLTLIPALYLGQDSDFAHPILNLGVSSPDAQVISMPFPVWLLGPSIDLPTGRRWHFFFVWVFVINGAVYLIASLLDRHVWRDLIPSVAQLRSIGATIRHHLRLYFPRERDYNVLHKLVYLAVIFLLLPGIFLAGLAMSPGADAIFPWLTPLLGGRQTARTIHFACASLIALFIVVHLLLVLLSGVWNNIRAMITGSYAVDEETSHGR